jgi:FtsH-binding integral membrane protein
MQESKVFRGLKAVMKSFYFWLTCNLVFPILPALLFLFLAFLTILIGYLLVRKYVWAMPVLPESCAFCTFT